MTNRRNFLIFGGAGFIGTHLTRYLIQNELASKVFIADLNTSFRSPLNLLIEPLLPTERIELTQCDVRKNISAQLQELGKIDVIVNLAAVHREPGHQPAEYFETNLLGAENINEFASNIDCRTLVFTSSIAPYGPTEEPRTEESLPVPETPYGCSKLVAEKIHESWAEKSAGNKLIILRPGVVFGAAEGGNVSRMVRAIRKNYFVYMGNKKTRKAGIYVKELCSLISWGLNRAGIHNVQLINAVMDPCPAIEDYCEVILKLLGRQRSIISTPYHLIYLLSFAVSFFSRIANIQQPINPVRIRKLVRSNNIQPKYLQDSGYKYEYSLEQAMSDWKNDLPTDWAD